MAILSGLSDSGRSAAVLSSCVVVGVEVLPLVGFIVLKIAVIPKIEIRDARHTVLNFFM